jgi:hypothetical protein
MVEVVYAGGGDATAEMQRLFDNASRGDTVVVPEGVKLEIDATRSIRMRPGTSLRLDGTLQALPNDRVNSAVVLLEGVDNIKISGKGTIIGDRYIHTGWRWPEGTGASIPGRPEHSNGHGVSAVNSSDVSISGISAQSCLGDGFYVQSCRNVAIQGVTANDSRRNGLSIIAGENISVVASLFAYSNGPYPLPQCGIDIEPDTADQNLRHIRIAGNRLVRNKGAGCYLAFDVSPTRSNIQVVGNSFDQHFTDGSGPPIGGKNDLLCNFLYAVARWVPGYDYWAFKREFVC